MSVTEVLVSLFMQTLTTARRNIDAALKQANELLGHLDTPKKVILKIVHGCCSAWHPE